MPAPGMRHAQRAQPAQSPVRDDAGAVVEQTRVEPRRPDDRIGIKAERAGSGRSPWPRRDGYTRPAASASVLP